MDTAKVLRKDEALNLVRRYKEVIAPRFAPETKVMMFGSYAKGHPHEWSDIDVAVIVPEIADDQWYDLSVALGMDVDKVSLLIEPVLMSDKHWSPLYDDVMKTGITV